MTGLPEAMWGFGVATEKETVSSGGHSELLSQSCQTTGRAQARDGESGIV